jgi:hypothetical protein
MTSDDVRVWRWLACLVRVHAAIQRLGRAVQVQNARLSKVSQGRVYVGMATGLTRVVQVDPVGAGM